MKEQRLLIQLTLLALFLALAPTALATGMWYVDGVHGNDQNNCRTPVTACKTMGHAISLASSGDFITVAAATYAENLAIGISLNVIGSGPTTTIVDGGGVNRVITIRASAHVFLARMTIRNGVGRQGGGISNAGVLILNDSTVSGNRASGFGATGGGIYNSGTMTVSNSTISGNNGGDNGGGISNVGTTTVSNSTLSGNSVGFYGGNGGGINTGGGPLAIINSTIGGNRTPNEGGGIFASAPVIISSSTISGNAAGRGGDIYGGSYTLQNSIVANSTSGGNCAGGSVTSDGYNLSSDNTCNFHQTGDLNNTNPLLGSLQNNGGPTQTEALLDGSPAIDAGNPAGCTDGTGHLLTTDQRGMPRPDHEDQGGCDIGAYERQMD